MLHYNKNMLECTVLLSVVVLRAGRMVWSALKYRHHVFTVALSLFAVGIFFD
jgi:hypothetical protein